jgi:predicted GNAT family acetyltransferase
MRTDRDRGVGGHEGGNRQQERRSRSSVDGVSEPPRSLYRLERVATIDRPLPNGLQMRTVTDGDDSALAELMERAYAGTVDEELGGNSDGAVEVADWRAEAALSEVSVAAVDADGIVVTASMCSGTWDREMWISYVITEPAWKGRGLATAAVAESVRRIRERSDVDVLAAVTDGNVPSERLLATVGFQRVGPV